MTFLERRRTQKAARNTNLQIFFPNHHLQHHPLDCTVSERIFKLLSTGFLAVWQWMFREIRGSLGVSMNHWSLLKVKLESIQRGEKFIRKAPFSLLQPWRSQQDEYSNNKVLVVAYIKAWWLQGSATVMLCGNCFDLYYESCFKADNKRPSPAPNKISSKTTIYLRENLEPGGLPTAEEHEWLPILSEEADPKSADVLVLLILTCCGGS